MNLNQKLLELKKAVPYLKKADKAYDYDYVAEDDVLAVVNEKMNALGLLLVPSVVQGTAKWARHDYVTAKGKPVADILATADMTYSWIDAETGERMDVPWVMFGQQDDASQAIGSGITYCGRYFLLKFLQIATGKDDPDRWRSERKRLIEQTEGKKPTPPPAPRPAPADAPPLEKPSEKPVSEWSVAEVRSFMYSVGGGKSVSVNDIIERSPDAASACAWFDAVSHNARRTPTEKSVAARAIAMLQPLPWDDAVPPPAEG